MKSLWTKIKKFCRKYVSSVFIWMLVVSTILWYLTKLSYDYTTEIPVTVKIEESQFKVQCMAEGSGYRLFSFKFFKQEPIELDFHSVQLTPSLFNPGHFVINAYSLQNVISVRIKELKIISIGNIPEIEIDYDNQ